AIGAALDQLDRKPVHIARGADKAHARIAVGDKRLSRVVAVADFTTDQIDGVTARGVIGETARFDEICAGCGCLIFEPGVEAVTAVVVTRDLSAIRTVKNEVGVADAVWRTGCGHRNTNALSLGEFEAIPVAIAGGRQNALAIIAFRTEAD